MPDPAPEPCGFGMVSLLAPPAAQTRQYCSTPGDLQLHSLAMTADISTNAGSNEPGDRYRLKPEHLPKHLELEVDPQVLQALEQMSQRSGRSLNEIALELLSKALGAPPPRGALTVFQGRRECTGALLACPRDGQEGGPGSEGEPGVDDRWERPAAKATGHVAQIRPSPARSPLSARPVAARSRHPAGPGAPHRSHRCAQGIAGWRGSPPPPAG